MRADAVVLLLDYTPKTWGSREDFHKRLAVKMMERGYAAILVLAKPVSTIVEDHYRGAGIRLVYFNYAEGGKTGFYRFVRGLQQEFRIRMVHIRYFDYFSLLPWILRIRGVKIVFFTEANSGVVRATGLKLALLRLRTAFVTYPLSRAIAISEYIRGRLIQVGIPRQKTAVVFNGVDETDLRPDASRRTAVRAKFGLADDQFTVFWMAEFRPMKRLDVALRAILLLKQRGIRAAFLVAGDGELREDMKTLARELGIDDQVSWMGFHPAPSEVMPAGDVFVLPSEGEAFGFVIAEAMCCGLPVVGARHGAIPELIVDGENGFLAKPGDPEAFAAPLEKLARDPKYRAEMGIRARKWAMERFTLDTSVENTLRVYESVWHA